MKNQIYECCLYFRVYKHNEIVLRPVIAKGETSDISNLEDIIKALSNEMIKNIDFIRGEK